MKFIVKWITYTQYYGGEIEEDETIEEEYNDIIDAERVADQRNRYGCRGQYVEVYINDKYYRDYEV